MEKFTSRKFWICLFGISTIIALKGFDRLGDWPFSALFGGLILVYLFIQGQVDIAALRISTDQIGLNDKISGGKDENC